MYVKTRVESDKKKGFVWKIFDATVLPEILPPVGLTGERQQYLFRNVRPAQQESLCPTPLEE
jgi:hypothetical protein